METLEITSVSTKGQIVIPQSIRSLLNIVAGDRFIVASDGSNILLKPIVKPNLSEFQKLVEDTDAIVDSLEADPANLSDFIKRNRTIKSA